MNRILAAALIGTFLTFSAVGAASAATVASVNGVPISDVQVSQRVALLKLEGGGTRQKALDGLITEQLQLQEATRLGITVTDQQVNDAFQQVARNVKVSTDKLNEILRSAGVSEATMKERLRAALAWQGVAEVAVRSRVDVSELELDQAASAQLGNEMSYDYILKEVLFIATTGNASKRTAEANRYRGSFAGCDSAVKLSLSYTDAAVRDIGRRHATQLPEALAGELAGLSVGGISKPRVVENGVSMLAVCSKSAARDTTFIKNKLRSEQGSAAMKTEAEKYLAELRSKAQIAIQ